MINLVQGNNQAYVTLSEKVELAAPVFLLKVTSQSNSDDIKIAVVTDSSNNANRTNRIAIEVVTSSGLEDLANGQIYLTGGDYIYEFYESADSTLDISGKKLLERGYLRYNTEEIETNYSDSSSQDITYNG